MHFEDLIMSRAFAIIVALSFLAGAALADDKKPAKPDKKDAKDNTQNELQPRKTGRPGELSDEEEDRLDRIINRFIDYDIGLNRDRRAPAEFDELGPEAIPALIRGINRAATMSHSCPVSVIYKKLRSLLRSSDDERVLAFARDNIGAGLRRSPYQSLLNDLKITCMLRTRQLDELRREAALKARNSSPGNRSPGDSKPE
jgi:hypothetical protein